ncbi:MAG: trehalase family glycosidase [Bacteroidota bacterium]
MSRTYFVIGLCCLLGGISCVNVPAPDNQIASESQLQQHLLQGWNTWNNPSVLSHVLMPYGLNVQLVLRKTRRGPYWLDDAYFSNKRYAFPEKLVPAGHAYDGSFTSLQMEWEGQAAKVHTASEGEDFVLHYEPADSQSTRHILLVEIGFLWNKGGRVEKTDAGARIRLDNKTVTLHKIGEENQLKLPRKTPYLSFWSDEEMMFSIGKKRSRKEILDLIAEKKEAYESRSAAYNQLSEAYESIQILHAWNTIYDANNERLITPVSRVWNEAWGGYILFDWDTYFTALMLSLDQKEMAYSNAIAITNAISENGFVPNVETYYLKSEDRSQPPVGAMICKLIYDRYQEDWFLEAVYDNLLGWNRWWDEHRNNQGFLSWGSDPHPNGMDGHSKQGAKWESGLDNSPLFDEAVFNEETHMLELASAGLMGLYVADCQYMAEIATILGREEDAKELLERREKYANKLQELWDEEAGIFRDKYLNTGEFSSHLAPTNFYPLIGNVPTQAQAERMIEAHFMNPDEFYGEWMMPSIARNDPAYPDNSYWRGRIWAPMNFLVYMGLRNYQLPKAREMMVEKSLALIMKSWREERTVYENYNSTSGVGGDVRNSSSFYSWGALLAFIALMEDGHFPIK